MVALSKKATDLIKGGSEVSQVFSTYGNSLSQKLAELFQSQRGGIQECFESFQNFVERRMEALESADIQLLSTKSDLSRSIQERDELLNKARRGFSHLKKSLVGIYGKEVYLNVGLSSRMPNDPSDFERMLNAAITTLTQKPNLPDPIDPQGPRWEVEHLLDRLKDIHDPLEKALDQVQRFMREVQKAQIERRQAMENLQQAIVSANAVLVNLAKLAGETELADRIRPSGNKGRKTENQKSETEEKKANT